MNKKLDKIVYGISSQENILLVKFFSRGLIIPGFLTIEGKDLKEYLATKAPLMLSEEEVSKITIDSASINKHTLSDQETILSYFDDYMEDIIDFFQYNVSIIRQILALITDLIPSNLNAKEKIISQEINRFSKMALFFLAEMENSIPRGLKKTFDEISLSDPISRKKNMMRTISLMNILIEFNFLTIRVVWCHQHVYEYYHGLKCKKNENANMNIQTIIDTIVSCVQNINNLEKGMEQVVKTTEQTIKNTETINNTLNEMKENQNKTNELIEKRNEKEKTKRLQISECAEDICKILKDDYNVIVKQNTIAKYLRRFDADLKKGKKIALPSYESAMFFNKVFFIVWIRETFAPYYLLHRKIKVKNKTPRCSSSDAAFNEAARQKYEEDEEINDSY